MTNTTAPCEVFEARSTDGDTLLLAYSPAKFDKRLVSTLKGLRGVSCSKTAHGFRWMVAASHICADDFRAAFAAAAARSQIGGFVGMNGANLAAKMDDRDSDY